MKFLLISCWFPPTKIIGGVIESCYRTSASLVDLGHDVTVICTDAGQSGRSGDKEFNEIKKNGLKIVTCRKFLNERYGATLEIYKIFTAIKARPDVVISEFFSCIAITSMIFAYFLKVPFILFPHGALMPNARAGSIKKKFFMTIIGDFLLDKASCIVATSKDEKNALHNYLQNKDVCIDIVAHGCHNFDFSKHFDVVKLNNLLDGFENHKIVLYLNRISKEKGLERLILAWKNLQSDIENSVLVIAGDGDASIVEWLKKEIAHNKLKNQILFIGPVFGDVKWRLLSRSDIFILPSTTENFSMVVVESLMSKTPVIATKGTPWSELNDFNCGVWVDNNVFGIECGIKMMLSYTAQEIGVMGENGRELVLSKYTWEKTAKKIIARSELITNADL
jgi:glycosyltransferase involved in cell wall biosynthesis